MKFTDRIAAGEIVHHRIPRTLWAKPPYAERFKKDNSFIWVTGMCGYTLRHRSYRDRLSVSWRYTTCKKCLAMRPQKKPSKIELLEELSLLRALERAAIRTKQSSVYIEDLDVAMSKLRIFREKAKGSYADSGGSNG